MKREDLHRICACGQPATVADLEREHTPTGRPRCPRCWRAWLPEKAALITEAEELIATIPQRIREELVETLPHHRRGVALSWAYGRSSYLLELSGELERARALRDEGEEAMKITPRRVSWDEDRRRIASKMARTWNP